jgi:glycosyltransferase involved in cell wall biosynthesis
MEIKRIYYIMEIEQDERKILPDITIILPIYNEVDNIENVFKNLNDILNNSDKTYEIIAVDDGSTDGTLTLLLSLKDKNPFMRIISHVYNKGNSCAIRTGIRFARANIIITMDADGQHDPKYILKIISGLSKYDMIIGSRTHAYKGKSIRNMGNIILNKFASAFTQTRITDLTSGFRAFKKQTISHFLHLFPNGFGFESMITVSMIKSGYSINFFPIEFKERLMGESKINIINDGIKFIIIILKIIVLYDPFKIFLPFSILFITIGLITMIAGIIVASKLIVPGSSVVFYVAGIFTFLLGLLSNQIATINTKYYGDEIVKTFE